MQCTTDLNGQTRLQKEGYPISYGGHWDNNYMYNENTKMFKSTNKHWWFTGLTSQLRATLVENLDFWYLSKSKTCIWTVSIQVSHVMYDLWNNLYNLHLRKLDFNTTLSD